MTSNSSPFKDSTEGVVTFSESEEGDSLDPNTTGTKTIIKSIKTANFKKCNDPESLLQDLILLQSFFKVKPATFLSVQEKEG
jgi:hypothetical protein